MELIVLCRNFDIVGSYKKSYDCHKYRRGNSFLVLGGVVENAAGGTAAVGVISICAGCVEIAAGITY